MFGLRVLSFAIAAASAISVDPDGSIDIGTVGVTGQSVGSGSDWVVSGSGTDIWGSTDHMHYMYFNRTADVTVTAKVNSFDRTYTMNDRTGQENWRKGGIMFRKDLGARSPHSMMQVTGWGIANQWRTCDACGSGSEHDSYSTKNVWIKLVKQGTTITSYVKRDSDYGWLKYHSVEIDLGESFFVGLAACAHHNEDLAALDVSNFEISDEIFTTGATGGDTEIGDTGRDVWVQQKTADLWSIYAAGSGISGTADSFGFMDSEHTGDIIATVHLEKLTRRNGDTKGGLMIRASHEVDAPHVSLLVNKNDGLKIYSRSTAGGDTVINPNVGVWQEDVELKLEKIGNTVTASYKHRSAAEWYIFGSATAEFGDSFFVGKAVSSHDHGDRVELTAGVLDVTPMTV